MTNRFSLLGAGVVSAALVVGTPLAASAHGPSSHGHDEEGVVAHNVISSKKGEADLTDPTLGNMWGLAAGPDSSVWASNMAGSTSIILRGGVNHTPFSQVQPSISIPGGPPSGQVFNDTKGFVVPGSKDPARFIIAGLGGAITAWNSGTAAVQVAHTDTAEYTGIDIIDTHNGPEIAATDFHNNRVDVFDSKFRKISTRGFQDRNLPKGYAPFNVEQIGNDVFVTYGLQDANKLIDVPGKGHGFVDEFRTDGQLERRFASRGTLSSPWGMVVAPHSWGKYAGKILVGNLGDGRVNVFDPHSGHLLGQLTDTKGKPVVIPGLWGLIVGNDTAGGSDAIWYAGGATADNPAHGIVGTLRFED
jgi:uncharacterized protein (TIGR03118 family)